MKGRVCEIYIYMYPLLTYFLTHSNTGVCLYPSLLTHLLKHTQYTKYPQNQVPPRLPGLTLGGPLLRVGPRARVWDAGLGGGAPHAGGQGAAGAFVGVWVVGGLWVCCFLRLTTRPRAAARHNKQSADKRRLPFKDRLTTYLLLLDEGTGNGNGGSKPPGKGSGSKGSGGGSRKDGVVHGEAILRYLGRRFGMLGTWGRRVGGCVCGVGRGIVGF